MDLIDRYAHSNAIRCHDPAQKGALALLALTLCLLLDRPLAGLLTVGWMLGLTVLWARVPARVFGRLLLAQALFLTASCAAVAVSGGVGAPAAPWVVRAGDLWLGTGPAALTTALQPAVRALGCAAALNFLVLTTPVSDLIGLLRRLRAPAALADMLTLTYRAIFVLLASLEQLRSARTAEHGPADAALGGSANLAGQLFVEAYRRGVLLQLGLERGLDGVGPRPVPLDFTANRTAWWLGAALAASLLLSRLAG
ncbi:MAG TPA: CbiQ family ECF transporter T component [Chloroflexaceae bacterium]|nr:CbiQ family ECF transporter T component [Chloroflexaceae bacterium]